VAEAGAVTVAEVLPLRAAEGTGEVEPTPASEALAAVEMAVPRLRVQARQLERIQPQLLVRAHRAGQAEMLLAVMLQPATVAETAAEVAAAVVAVLPCKFDLPQRRGSILSL